MTGPTAHPSRRPGVRLPMGMVGMLAMVLVVEAVIGGHRAEFATPLAEDWRFSAWAAERQAPGSDVLCFGDSLIKYGVLPRVIEAGSGLKTYNLSTSGGTMPSAYFLFKRALDSGAKPQAVVADFAALMLPDTAPLMLQNYPELATVADCAELARIDGDPGFFTATMLAKLVPSYRWRFEVRGAILAAFGGRFTSQRQVSSICRRKWEIQRGAQPTKPGRVWHPREDYLIDGVSPAVWAIEPRNDAFLDRFLTLAKERGIKVYWLIPPLCPEVHARRNLRGTDAAYDRLVRSKLARYPDLVVLDARTSGYDNSVHLDHIHLDQVGASVLSADIANVLRGRSNPRTMANPWVNLPPYAGRAEVALRAPTIR